MFQLEAYMQRNFISTGTHNFICKQKMYRILTRVKNEVTRRYIKRINFYSSSSMPRISTWASAWLRIWSPRASAAMSEDLRGSMATRRMATVEWTSSTKGGHQGTEHSVADFTYWKDKNCISIPVGERSRLYKSLQLNVLLILRNK